MANLFALYEECRARAIAGDPLPAVRDTAPLVLAQPEYFLAVAGGSDPGGDAGRCTPYEAFIASWPTSDVLYTFLASRLRAIVKHKPDGLKPGCRGRYYAWTWGYWGRAAVNAFYALGEQRFADLVVETYEILLSERDDRLGLTNDIRKRPIKSWGLLSADGRVRFNEITSTGLILLPICDLLVGHATALLSAGRRDQFVASLVDALDEFTDEVQYEDTANGGYFRDPLSGNVEALNHAHVYAAALTKTWRITGSAGLRELAESIARYFLASCTLEDNDTYSWPYAPVPGKLRQDHPRMTNGVDPAFRHAFGAEAFYKAAVTIEFPVAAYDAGIGFDRQDMERIADCFVKNVFQPGDDLNVYVSSRKIRPGSEIATELKSQLMFIVCAGLLDSIRPQLRADVIRMLGRRPDWFPTGWFGQARAAAMVLTWFMRPPVPVEDKETVAAALGGRAL